ncbi:MAG TPA: hypothetical protein VMU39_20160 [Solirubrobacteraceae bacterium]|nr:hypothetical protein [Solirubrobacteraceae bacterium]
MSDVLAIVGSDDADDELLQEIAHGHADRVTVLVENAETDWASDESESGRAVRDRLAALLAAIERRTGAVVVGLAGSRDQLRGWRFDRVVGGRAALTA